jgi:hypothetical protein
VEKSQTGLCKVSAKGVAKQDIVRGIGGGTRPVFLRAIVYANMEENVWIAKATVVATATSAFHLHALSDFVFNRLFYFSLKVLLIHEK